MGTPLESVESNGASEGRAPTAGREAICRRIAVCLDGSELGERSIPHALAVGAAAGAAVTFLHVLERPPTNQHPPDPLEWELRRREARQYLARLAEKGGPDGRGIGVELIEGQAAEELCSWAQHHDTDLTVLSSHGARGRTEWGLASTAMKLVERAPGSVLLVPSEGVVPSGGVARYRRLLVPLDGSLRAESVLPLAVRIAAHQGAELLLAHVVPQPEITQIGPLSAEDLELRERLLRRNERVAGEYLDRLRSRLAESAVSLRALVLRGADVRGRLAHLIGDEAADLVVLSARGQGGRADVAGGGVTLYLMTHVAAPLLIVRQRNRRPPRRAAATPQATARLPSQALP